MILNYIPQNQRKKILLITDDISIPSGVGIMGNEIVTNSAHIFNWVNLGCRINTPHKNKILDVSKEVDSRVGLEDSYVKIYSYDSYGDITFLRNIIENENPDAILLITDPRYFKYIWENEQEIRRKLPIIYYNIWDNYPAPMYNLPYYESCDALLGISELTVDINKKVLGELSKDKIIDYVPHGRDEKVFRPLKLTDSKLQKIKKQLIPNSTDNDFVMFFNSRNMPRKNVSNTLLAWKEFMDKNEKPSNCYFILHTRPIDKKGTNLYTVVKDVIGKDYNIIFDEIIRPEEEMNILYNIASVTILASSNEGWGLALTESLLSGTPIIATMTGGMIDQMHNLDGSIGDWCLPIQPSSSRLIGSINTPYIHEQIADPSDILKQIESFYRLPQKEKNIMGDKARIKALESGYTSKDMTLGIVNNINKLFEAWKPRERFKIIKV